MRYSDRISNTMKQYHGISNHCGPIEFTIDEGFEFLTIDASNDPVVITLLPESPRDDS